MHRDLKLIGDRKLRAEIAEAMFNETQRGKERPRMLSDYDVNREYWETLADIAIERINRCLT